MKLLFAVGPFDIRGRQGIGRVGRTRYGYQSTRGAIISFDEKLKIIVGSAQR